MTVYLLTDKRGKVWGRYRSAFRAAEAAKEQWPDQDQDPDDTGKGWNVREERAEP